MGPARVAQRVCRLGRWAGCGAQHKPAGARNARSTPAGVAGMAAGLPGCTPGWRALHRGRPPAVPGHRRVLRRARSPEGYGLAPAGASRPMRAGGARWRRGPRGRCSARPLPLQWRGGMCREAGEGLLSRPSARQRGPVPQQVLLDLFDPLRRPTGCLATLCDHPATKNLGACKTVTAEASPALRQAHYPQGANFLGFEKPPVPGLPAPTHLCPAPRRPAPQQPPPAAQAAPGIPARRSSCPRQPSAAPARHTCHAWQRAGRAEQRGSEGCGLAVGVSNRPRGRIHLARMAS